MFGRLATCYPLRDPLVLHRRTPSAPSGPRPVPQSSSRSADPPSLYGVLGVPPDASPREVTSAYGRMLEGLKAAVGTSADARLRFQVACLAHEVLSCQESRDLYDRGGLDALDSRGAALADLLDRIEGRGAGADAADVRAILRLDLGEAATGGERVVRVEVDAPCPNCGIDDATGLECRACRGSGWAAVSSYISRERRGVEMRACPACGGSGAVARVTASCGSCRRGMVRTAKNVRVGIPSGVDTGTILRVRGAGNRRPGGAPPGDLYVGVIVREEEGMERVGRDVHSDVEVPLAVALLGGTVPVATLRGPRMLAVPPCTPHAGRLSLEGEGVGRGGAHHFRVRVRLPDSVSGEERRILRALASAGDAR